MAFIICYIGYSAYTLERQKRAEVFVYGAIFLAMLLLLSAFFDTVEILDSQDDNENLCNLKGHFTVHEGISMKYYECTFFKYYLTVIMQLLSAGCLVSIKIV